MSLIKRKPTIRSLIQALTRKVDHLMATVEEVQAALATLTSDLEGLATAAQAEFAKLEAEVLAGNPPNLDPLKEAIDGIDAKVKAAVVPST
jgi:ABC-type transporter Mla subunit MlaD